MKNSLRTEFNLLLYKYGSTINLIIAINIFFFLFINLVQLGESLFMTGIHHPFPIRDWILRNTTLPADFGSFLQKPWTLLSYMFMHQEIFHILLNMLVLFFVGKIFIEFLGDKKFAFVYIFGGIAGGALFLLLYRFIPSLASQAYNSTLLGASAGIMAILVGTATLLPNYSVFVIFIGTIPLKWVAAFLVVVDLIFIPINNPGGHISHLGGALFGFLYIQQLNRGNDWALPFQRLFQKRKKTHLKVVSRNPILVPTTEKDQEQLVDEILDKISKTGFKSLSEKEKQTLNKASQNF